MKKLLITAFSLALLAASAAPMAAQEMADTREMTFRATVVDMSCKLVYDLSGEEMHRECAQVCADRGIPLGLLAENGTFYLPVSAAMPGEGANAMLRGHAEHTVTVTGRVISRGGIHSIIIDNLSMDD